MFALRVRSIVDGVMAVLFLVSAGLQWNDPDPVQWAAMYTAAAVLCILSARGKRTAPASLALALIALVWAATLVPDVAARAELADLVRRMEIMRPQVEEARELGGLLIVAGWMAVLTLAQRGRPAHSAHDAVR